MTVQLEAALALARAGVPVFPCRRDNKAPLAEHGFKDASADPELVRRCWSRFPDALVGVPTGEPSGLWVLDLDVDRETGEHLGAASIAGLGIAPPPWVVHTSSGGEHWLYRHRDGLLGNTAGRLRGVDSRGDGGYAIAWNPDVILRALRDPALPEPPEELIQALVKPKPVNGTAYAFRPGDAEVWAETALDAEATAVAHAAEGSRNHTLNVAAFNLGQIVGGGHLERGRVIAELAAAAAACGLGPRETERTIRSGLGDGMDSPRGPRGDNGPGPKSRGNGPGHAEPEPEASAPLCLALDDFVSLMSPRGYVFLPTRDHWVASAVNARVPRDGELAASAWLDRNRPVEQATWAPGEPLLIRDRLIAEGGWIQRPGCTVLNLYRPPTIVPRPGDASPWLDHLYSVYPGDGDHLIKWFAMRVQRPHVKTNHSLVLGGEQGIGKDTILEPVKRGVGPWNVAEVSPQQVLGRFNGWLKSVMICINETRDLGDFDRFAFYDHLKTYTVTPPNVLRIDEKNLREYSILNLCGIVQTTNHKTDGIYLPPGDRRTYVAWSDATPADFGDGYWAKLHRWFDNGGAEIIAGYLHHIDLRTFDPKAPPPKTAAFWEIVNANQAPENSEMADALEKCGWPDAVTINQIRDLASPEFGEWLGDRRNARRIPHRLEECGYIAVRSLDADDGRWRVGGRRQTVYANKKLSPALRLQAAADLTESRL